MQAGADIGLSETALWPPAAIPESWAGPAGTTQTGGWRVGSSQRPRSRAGRPVWIALGATFKRTCCASGATWLFQEGRTKGTVEEPSERHLPAASVTSLAPGQTHPPARTRPSGTEVGPQPLARSSLMVSVTG